MAQSGKFQLGIDIGSTTVKAVFLGEDDRILWKKYERHNARQPELVLEFLKQLEQQFGKFRCDVYVTGSGGRMIAPLIGGHYIQEVNAVTYAVEKLYPDAGSVIELGG